LKIIYSVAKDKVSSPYFGALQSLNDNYEQIVKSAREVFEDFVSSQKAKDSAADEDITSGKRAMELIRAIDDSLLSRDTDPAWQERNVATLKWFQENFEKMTPLERKAATDYLTQMQQSVTRGHSRGGLDTDTGVPIGFDDEVKSKMNDIGAGFGAKNSYKWSGKRDDLVEGIRNRVRQLIAESIKK